METVNHMLDNILSKSIPLPNLLHYDVFIQNGLSKTDLT